MLKTLNKYHLLEQSQCITLNNVNISDVARAISSLNVEHLIQVMVRPVFGAEVYISTEDVEWAEYIFVMEQAHKKKLKQQFREQIKNQKIICLGIPDNYEYMEDALI